jgi:hypothetical protein
MSGAPVTKNQEPAVLNLLDMIEGNFCNHRMLRGLLEVSLEGAIPGAFVSG